MKSGISQWNFNPSCHNKHYCLMLCIAIIILVFLHMLSKPFTAPNIINFFHEEKEAIDFTNFNNFTGYHKLIVPNIVHFIHFKNPELSFIEVVSIRAAFLHQHPEKIIIHCDCYSLKGKYWDMVKDIPNLEIRFLQQQMEIFGKPLSTAYLNFHSSDLARIQVLMEYGGIYLDSDSYIVQSLDYFREFEMAIGWPPNQNLGSQVIVAHKNARFLPLWLNTYHQYNKSLWYYNAGVLPTQSILKYHPELVHRVPIKFGVDNGLVHMLYAIRSEEWRDFYAIHLLIRHKHYLVPSDPVKHFDEETIKSYNRTFGDMARLVIYGKTDIIE